ncbi:two-component sensor histidine kinase [Virgisporangium aliadipatigenens]|uniref:histidine kinase n=1 Tax=Virgisporangium aliadipatigenens TaxID=741659 RepID=A0A8J3YIP6_9ACTN|nr:HAMP domain-containing sensor histidine kinase [Virgisporangium aliadipatigenens]GIJ46064.1 two-component sensor histidine kinase [Virgisporangium aliadipatigenens]
MRGPLSRTGITWSLRGRLTLLYAVPFLLSAVVLVGIPILQTRVTAPVGSASGAPPVPDPYLERLFVGALLGLAAVSVVAVAAGWLVAGRFLRPLRTITATARDISASNLHRRLGPSRRDDEFARLSSTLDELFARLEAAFEAQRRFVANAAHELRTPLTAERTLLQVALADPDADPETLRAACRDVLSLGRAQERLIDALLTLATSEQGLTHREPLDLATIAAGVLDGRADAAKERGVRVESDLAAAPTTGDPRLVESLVANLVDNAIRHNVPDGWLRVETTPARVVVANSGPHVAAAEIGRLLEPFQRQGAQRVRHSDGYGLGLAIVRAIANAHAADLTVHSRPDGGLDVTVTFP